jgi:hypothetical protein
MVRRLFTVVVCALAAITLDGRAAAASPIAIGWDANIEPNIAGYVVQWGPVSAPFTNSVDVGNATTWTLGSATDGATYSFRVLAYNTSGEYSDPSAPMNVTAGTAAAPSMLLGRSYLNFGVARNGATVLWQTSAQTVTITKSGTGTMTWTAASSQPWIQVSPASGSGSGVLTVTLNPALAPASTGNADAVITITSPEAANGPLTIAVHVAQMSSTATASPIGSFDTPIDNATNLAGAIAVTGWALDDVEVKRIDLWRDAVGSEPSQAGKVFIGNAVFVSGARPDVETLATATPFNYRAGWGYLLLTNALPDNGRPTGGNGTFRLYAYAVDAEDHQSLLGSKQITVSNATAVAPFGTLDTPSQGQTIGGNAFVSFGWALSPHGTIPADGSTIDVYVDGVNLGHPVYNNYRADIATGFAGYANSNGAVGFFVLDTTTLSNGVHTIGWMVRDGAGNADGLGSRFFTVFNAGAVTGAQTAAPPAAIADLPAGNDLIEVHRAAAPGQASFAIPGLSGGVTVRAAQMETIELRLANRFGAADGARYEGFQLVRDEPRQLPAGSSLDPVNGVFRWQPGPAFVGSYDLIFIRTDASGLSARITVRIEIQISDARIHD